MAVNPEEQLKRLTLARRAHRGQLTKLVTAGNQFVGHLDTDDNLETLAGILQSVDTKLTYLYDLDAQIQAVTGVEDLETTIIDSDDYLEKRKHEIRKLINTHKVAFEEFIKADADDREDRRTTHRAPHQRKRTNLPKLTLPRFTGDVLQWSAFCDSFTAAVVNDDTLDDVERFQYLKAQLDGEADRLIAGFTLTNANYGEAWTLLQKRYGQEHKIVSAHMKSLWELQRPTEATQSLKEFIDSLETHIRGLRSLGKTEDTYGDLLAPIVFEKLPAKIKTQMSRDHGDSAWSLDQLKDAINREIEANIAGEEDQSNPSEASAAMFLVKSRKSPYKGNKAQQSSPSQNHYGSSPQKHGSSPQKHGDSSQKHGGSSQKQQYGQSFRRQQKCAFCDGRHRSADCRTKRTLDQRKEVVTEKNLCFNCLRPSHSAVDCESRFRCLICQRKHHTALHSNSSNPDKDTHQRNRAEETVVTFTPAVEKGLGGPILLKTARAKLWNTSQKVGAHVNILMDEGAQRTFITEDTAQQLGFDTTVRRSENINLSTFGAEKTKTKRLEIADLKLETVNGEPLELSALIVPQISTPVRNYVPSTVQEHGYLQGLKLAGQVPSDSFEINLLIGADYYWKIVGDQIIRGPGPTAVSSKLGYLLSGPSGLDISVFNTTILEVLTSSHDEEQRLKEYWDLETIGIKEDETLQNFNYEDYTKHLDFKDGRYIASMPWKEDHPPLSSNFTVCAGRTRSMVRRLDPDMRKIYNNIIKEQESRGFIELVKESLHTDVGHYIPHHSVVKDSLTTPIRIVYDCSCKTPEGTSLNDCLEVGPNLTNDLVEILLRFRIHPIGLVSDIEKAFLNIELQPEDRDYTRFLWLSDWDDPDSEFITYRFKAVLFGSTSSPFILNAVLRNHLESSPSKVTEDLMADIYVDNVVGGAPDEETAAQKYHQSIQILQEGGFNLRSWASNSSAIQTLAEEDGRLDADLPNVKVLGMYWNTREDNLCYKQSPESELAETKRQIVRETSTLFDPLGFLMPVHIRAKIFIQKLWTEKVQWDDTLSEDLQEEWKQIQRELEAARSITIKRPYFANSQVQDPCELHIFADASTQAYGAVAYIKQGEECAFVMSRSRVKPLKEVTLPRLELLAAFVAAKLSQFLTKALHEIQFDQKVLWSDSQIVLHWISSSKRLPIFVANRVKTIKQADFKDIRYCNTKDNPADHLTRGISVNTLRNSELWLKGPSWLLTGDWPTWDTEKVLACHSDSSDGNPTDEPVEKEESQGISSVINIERFSKLGRLLRVTAYVLRFVKAIKKQTNKQGFISVPEIKEAKTLWIQSVQNNMFKKELEDLRSGRSKSRNPLVRQLKLFVDDQEIIRCGGRLHNARVSYGAKHPVLIPRQHHLTNLIIEWAHTMVLHARVTSTVTYIRSVYWIPRIRQVVKKILRTCVICRKVQGDHYPGPVTPPLPSCRLEEAPPFTITGVDFTGALYYKSTCPNAKAYICLFTCAVTRAVHLEVVTDMTTKTFIQAFRRFAARKSTPSHIISDNGSTFLCAAPEIRLVCEDQQVHGYLASRNVQWTFIPKRAPWFGGFYERLVGVTKTVLKKVLTRQLATFDELVTLITETEAIVNDRPITYSTMDLDEPIPLTPSMLLNGHMITTLPHWEVCEDTLKDPSFNETQLRTKLNHLDLTFKNLWKRWQGEYLPALREQHAASKLKGETENYIKVGDVVMVHEDIHKRIHWPLAVMTKLFPGKDGLVRYAEIRMKGGISNRPIKKLYPLEVTATVTEANDEHEVNAGEGHTESRTANPTVQEPIARPVRRAAAKAKDVIRNWIGQLGPDPD